MTNKMTNGMKMMKRALALCLGLVLLAGTACAENMTFDRSTIINITDRIVTEAPRGASFLFLCPNLPQKYMFRI